MSAPLDRRRTGRMVGATPAPDRDLSIPTGIDGLIGVQVVEAVAASHRAGAAWAVPASALEKAEV
ncbi:hypothetical protein [Kocuria nitroreducens]|uniref:hypothetical protein n=1 Tax=Kocuria nitroreducens TaxID=3058914 RepID=UPI0036DBD791